MAHQTTGIFMELHRFQIKKKVYKKNSKETVMNLDKRIQRWRDLYNVGPGKRVVRFIINYPTTGIKWPFLSPECKQDRIDWAKQYYEWELKNTEEYDDDNLPCLFPSTGTEIFAECFGSEIVRPHNNMPFALPVVSDSAGAAALKVPKLEDTPLMLLFEIADELRKFGGDDALIRLPDVQCPMDVAALIWDKNDFFPSMIDEPEAVIDLARKVKELQITFFDEWFRRYGNKYIAHFPNYYMEGGITMSADEIGCVSPQMFRDLMADEINDLSRYYGGVGIHTCADSKNQWENLKQIEGLKVINIHYDWDRLTKALEFFKDTCVQLPYCSNLSNIDPEDLPESCRVILPLSARDLNHAKELADHYGKYR